MAAGQSPWTRAWTAAYTPFARSACDTQKAPLQLQYAVCGAMLVLYAFALLGDPGTKRRQEHMFPSIDARSDYATPTDV